MSSNFYPSQTSQIPGIEGALNPQYPDAAQMPMPESGPPASPNYVEVLREHQVQTQEANAPQDSIQSYSINAKTGMAKIEIPQSALAEVMGQLTDLKTMKSAAMARVAQLRQQESSGSPLLDALSQFAGGMAANDPTMPGWVRALGQTNLQMGSQGIKRERMAEEQKAFAYGKELSDTAMEAAKFNHVVEQSAETNYLKAAEITRKMLDDQKTDNKEFSKLMGRVSAETRSLRDFDPETFAQEAKALGVSDEQIAAAQDKFMSLASMAQQKYDLEQRAKDKARREDERQKDERQAISIGAAMDRVMKSKDMAVVTAANKLDMKDEDFLSSARAYDEYLKQAEAVINEYGDVMGPVSGRLTKLNPFRRAKAQKAMAVVSTNLQRFMQSQGESVARGSDKDMKLFERGSADITNTPEQALVLLQQQRAALKQKFTGVIEVNPYADWRGRYGVVLPEWARPIVDDTLRRAAAGPGMALPSGAKAGGTQGLPAGWKIEEVK